MNCYNPLKRQNGKFFKMCVLFDPIILLLVAVNVIIPMLRSKITDVRIYERYIYGRIANRSKKLKKQSNCTQIGVTQPNLGPLTHGKVKPIH